MKAVVTKIIGIILLLFGAFLSFISIPVGLYYLASGITIIIIARKISKPNSRTRSPYITVSIQQPPQISSSNIPADFMQQKDALSQADLTAAPEISPAERQPSQKEPDNIQNQPDNQPGTDEAKHGAASSSDGRSSKHTKAYSRKPETTKKGFKKSNVTIKTNYETLGNFIAIDCETTGLSPLHDAIIEIAAVKFENWMPVDEFTTLVNPQRKVPKRASAVNHITDDMLVGAPTIDQVTPVFDSFIGNSSIVGQNIIFDLEFIQNAGIDLLSSKRKYYDTLELVGRVLTNPKSTTWDTELKRPVAVDHYDVENYKLGTLCEYYGIEIGAAHRALDDARATGFLFKKIVDDKLEKARNR